MNNSQIFYNYQNTNNALLSNSQNKILGNDINIKNKNIYHSVYNPLLLNIPKPNQSANLLYTPRTPSPLHRTRNIINLQDNHRFKSPTNSPVFYRKLKDTCYQIDSQIINQRVLENIHNFPLEKFINNNNYNRLAFSTNSPSHFTIENKTPNLVKNLKDRKFIIHNANLRKHSYDNINYHSNSSRNIDNITNKKNPLPIIHNHNNNNIYLITQNNYNLNNDNYKKNINLKIFNEIKRRQNSEPNLNISLFSENNQGYKYQESIEETSNNPYQNYISSIDITKTSDTSQNNKYPTLITTRNNDRRNGLFSNENNQNYLNKINLTNNNIKNFEMVKNEISRIHNNINKNEHQIFVEKENFPNGNIKKIEAQLGPKNIIPIPKFKSHFHFKENGLIIKNANPIQQPNLIPNNNTNLNEFKVIKQIGKGTFGDIYAVQWIKNNQLYALKKLKLFKEELNMFQEKVKILKNLLKKTGHNGFIKIYVDKYIKLKNEDEYYYYIIMELGERDWIKELKNRESYFLNYSEIELLGIIKQLVKTLAIMQKNKVTHRDIKPHNILLCKGLFKICDFGESKILKGNGQVWQHIRGSELYMSPIIFYALRRNEKKVMHNTYKSDVFSLGMCILLAAGFSRKLQCDIREVKDMNIITKIINNALNKRYSQNLINLIIQMLQIDENLRYDFIELEKYILSIWP